MNLYILCIIALKLQISVSTQIFMCNTSCFSQSLFDNFYITRVGNKILLSGITNGVPCAVKIARGTRNCCTRRASVLNGLLFEKIIARVRAMFRAEGAYSAAIRKIRSSSVALTK